MERRRVVAVVVFALLATVAAAGGAIERDAALSLAARVAPGGADVVVNVDGRTDFPASSAHVVAAVVAGVSPTLVYRGTVQIAGASYTLVGIEGHDAPNGTAAVASPRARPFADLGRPVDVLALRRVLPPVTVLHEMEFMRPCETPTFAPEREVCIDGAATAAENVTVLRVSVPKDARRLAFYADVRELAWHQRPARWSGTFEDPSGSIVARFELEVPRGATALPPPYVHDGTPILAPGTWTVRFALEANGTALAGLAGVVALDAPRPGAPAPDARSPVDVAPGRLLVSGPTTPPEAARDADLVTNLATAQALFGASGRVTEARFTDAPGSADALGSAVRAEALRSLSAGPGRDVTREALSVRDLARPRADALAEVEASWIARAAATAPGLLAAAFAAFFVLDPRAPRVPRQVPLAGAVATLAIALGFVLFPDVAFVLGPLAAFAAAGTLALAARAGAREAGILAGSAGAFAVAVALSVVSASAAAASERASPSAYAVTDGGSWRAVRLPGDAVVRVDGVPQPAGVILLGADPRLAVELPGLLETAPPWRGTFEIFEVLPTSPRAAVVTEPLTRGADGTPGIHGVGSTLLLPGVGGDLEFTVVAVLDARAPAAVFVAPSNLDALFGGASSATFARSLADRDKAEAPGPPIAAIVAAGAAVVALGAATRSPARVAVALVPAAALGAAQGLGAWRAVAAARVVEAGVAFDGPSAALAAVACVALFAIGRGVAIDR